MDSENVVVPVIDKKSLTNISEKIKAGVDEGSRLIFGGEILKDNNYEKGNYVQPTLFDNVDPKSLIATEEIFGPVLGLIDAEDYDQSIKIANDTSYGLSAGIFTSNLNLAMEFANNIDAGIVKINGETAGVEPQVPFGGMKESSSGAREQGKSAVEFFTQTKTIYVDEVCIMYLGTQFAARTDADYETFKQLGVNNINGFPDVQHQKWTVENLIQYREKVESFGLNLDMVQLPLSSADIDTRVKNGEFYNILTGTSPERDYEIERICEIISMCSDAGIPAVKYNLNIIGIPRTKSEFGRGGAKLSTFRWDEADKNAPDTYAGKVSEDVFWERIDYFLDKVVPVAEEKKVRLACHPHDPYTPPGYKGVTRVLGTVEGLKKFISIRENEYHGLNFCQGTITEMMDNPGEEIFDVN
ncbi:MAG: hypothetical protein CM15mP129_04130 [Chloroflexota bacterium]|nr:MAG: hypothetical protein CM15mP129_04130 [Chloroflexota bacterium]